MPNAAGNESAATHIYPVAKLETHYGHKNANLKKPLFFSSAKLFFKMKKTNIAACKMGGSEIVCRAFAQLKPRKATESNPANNPVAGYDFAGNLLTQTKTDHANYFQLDST